jgi:hypothetical protein
MSRRSEPHGPLGCWVTPPSVAGLPEFKELIRAQDGNERMGQLGYGACLTQF